MYAAKEARAGHKLYAPELDRHSMERLTVLGDLRRALVGDEIVIHYQPIVDARTGATVSAEALTRWQHPVGYYVSRPLPADAFIQWLIDRLASPAGAHRV